MSDLFIKKAEFKKTAGHMVNRDASHWVKDVITHFLSNYPQLQDAGLSVDWKRKDASKGYGVGALNIGNATVPIIIKDYILAPMDVIMFDGKAYPLTTESLNMYLSSPEAFKGVDSKVTGQNLSLFGMVDNSMFTNYGTGNSREGVSYSERPAIKLASFIDYVSGVREKDVNALLDSINSDPTIKNGFEINQTTDILEKIANKEVTNPESFAEGLLRTLEVDRNLVYNDQHGNYFLKQANSKVDYTWDTPISYSEAQEIKEKCAETPEIEKVASTASANAYEMLDSNQVFYINAEGEYTKFNEGDVVPSQSIKLAGCTPQKGDYGVWKINNKVSDVVEIIDFEKVAKHTPVNSYEMFNSDRVLYVSEEGNHEISTHSVEKTAQVFKPEGDNPNLGDFGTFIIGDKAENPFEITSIQKVANAGAYEIVGYNGFEKISYFPLKGVKKDQLIPHEMLKNAFYVPGNAKFVKLSGSKTTKDLNQEINKAANLSELKIITRANRSDQVVYPVSLEAPDLINHVTEKNAYYLPRNAEFIKLTKEIEIEHDRPYEKVAHHCGRDSAGLYYLEGPEFRKYAETHEVRNLNAQEAKWSLIHCGAAKEDVEKLANLQPSEVVAIRNEIQAPAKLSEIEGAMKTAYDKASVSIDKLRCDLIKEASVLQDKGTVDAVLSLNLLNKENIMDYIQLAPNLEKTASDLAKTLITVRMGLSHIPEQAVKTAMVSLAGVAATLRQLESVVSEVN